MRNRRLAQISLIVLFAGLLTAYTNCGPSFTPDGALSLSSHQTDVGTGEPADPPVDPVDTPVGDQPTPQPNSSETPAPTPVATPGLPPPTPTPTPSYPANPIPTDVRVQNVAGGFQFTEGPAWSPQNFLVFADLQSNRLYKYTEGNNDVSVLIQNTQGMNGTAFDRNGLVVSPRGGARDVVRVSATGQITVLASHYNNVRFNSPNDLAIFTDNSVYFTDPLFGNGRSELGFFGIYRIQNDGTVVLLDKTFKLPNGLVFSPDHQKMYVSDTADHRVYQFDVATDGSVSNKRLFFAVPSNVEGNSGTDGMAVDMTGNVYVTCRNRIWVVKPSGVMITSVLVGNNLTNVAFGGEDFKSLYITAGTTLYRIRTLIPGAR